jgi:hypothetical protein
VRRRPVEHDVDRSHAVRVPTQDGRYARAPGTLLAFMEHLFEDGA